MVNNKFTVIDAHCHIYPDKIAEAASSHTEKFYEITKMAYDGKVATLLSTMESSGVDRFVVQSVATTPKQVNSINSFIAAEVSKHPDLFIGVGTLHPDSEKLKDDVKQITDLGLHGVKLHPDIQNFKIDDYRCLKIYELCEENGLPILIHTGDKRYDMSNPNRMAPILEIYKNLTVIGAHLGGYSVWDDAVKMLCGYKNFYVDCSSSFFALSKETAKAIILKYGTDRVLFGSDYPMWNAKTEIDCLLRLGLSDEDYEKIFYKNALKVYKAN